MFQQTRMILAKTPLVVRVFGLYVLAAAVIIPAVLLHQPARSIVYGPIAPPKPIVSTQAHRVVSGTPDHISVDRLGITLPVNPGTYDASTGEWTLSDDAAFFATMTQKPNDYRGSTFIYGHDREAIFAPLEGLQLSDQVQVHTTNGHTFVYAYSHDVIVTPDVTDILYADPDTPQLTLMTCDGIFSQVRRIMTFDFVEVRS